MLFALSGLNLFRNYPKLRALSFNKKGHVWKKVGDLPKCSCSTHIFFAVPRTFRGGLRNKNKDVQVAIKFEAGGFIGPGLKLGRLVGRCIVFLGGAFMCFKRKHFLGKTTSQLTHMFGKALNHYCN